MGWINSNPHRYLTEEDATVCMSTNVIFCVRWKMGDSSSENEEIVDTLEVDVVADRSNISRGTGKSEIQRDKSFDKFYSLSNPKQKASVIQKHSVCDTNVY